MSRVSTSILSAGFFGIAVVPVDEILSVPVLFEIASELEPMVFAVANAIVVAIPVAGVVTGIEEIKHAGLRHCTDSLHLKYPAVVFAPQSIVGRFRALFGRIDAFASGIRVIRHDARRVRALALPE